jgi:hypothetical protein
MNTFWLKVAGVVVLVVVVIVAIATFSGKGEPKKPLKTVYDQWDEDQKKLTAKPQVKEPNTQQQSTQQPPPQRVVKSTGPVTEPEFKELSPEEEVEAERLWQWALDQRKMGRLPGMSYRKMVDACREIIKKWPESKYAFYAKRALADLSDKYKKMYNITNEETNLGNLK